MMMTAVSFTQYSRHTSLHNCLQCWGSFRLQQFCCNQKLAQCITVKIETFQLTATYVVSCWLQQNYCSLNERSVTSTELIQRKALQDWGNPFEHQIIHWTNIVIPIVNVKNFLRSLVETFTCFKLTFTCFIKFVNIEFPPETFSH